MENSAQPAPKFNPLDKHARCNSAAEVGSIRHGTPPYLVVVSDGTLLPGSWSGHANVTVPGIEASESAVDTSRHALTWRIFRNHYMCDACPLEWEETAVCAGPSFCPCCERETPAYLSLECEEPEVMEA